MAFNFDPSALKPTRAIKPPRLIVYGVTGIGKTTMVSGIPGSVIQATEDPGPGEGVWLPQVESFSDVMEVIENLTTKDHNFKVYGLDTLSALERMIWQGVAHSQNKRSIGDISFHRGYEMAVDWWEGFTTALDKLRDERNMAVVLTAHVQVKAFKDPTSESYDQFRLKLHDKAAEYLTQWADALLFANYETHTVTDGEGFKARTRAVSTGNRVLYTTDSPAHRAKNRYKLEKVIPMEWQSISDGVTKFLSENN